MGTSCRGGVKGDTPVELGPVGGEAGLGEVKGDKLGPVGGEEGLVVVGSEAG